MARRIPVVLSQAAVASADARQLEEDLVAQLLFEDGVDTNVVPHLTQLTEGSTGLLCLEGIKGEFVLLTWLEPQAARSMLAERGVRGRTGGLQPSDDRSGTAAAATAASGRADRNIHILQLQPASPTSGYLGEIQRIRDAAQIRTFELDLSGPSPATGPAARPAQLESPPAIRPAPPAAATTYRDPLPAGDELDQLLDQLDALDL